MVISLTYTIKRSYWKSDIKTNSSSTCLNILKDIVNVLSDLFHFVVTTVQYLTKRKVSNYTNLCNNLFWRQYVQTEQCYYFRQMYDVMTKQFSVAQVKRSIWNEIYSFIWCACASELNTVKDYALIDACRLQQAWSRMKPAKCVSNWKLVQLILLVSFAFFIHRNGKITI